MSKTSQAGARNDICSFWWCFDCELDLFVLRVDKQPDQEIMVAVVPSMPCSGEDGTNAAVDCQYFRRPCNNPLLECHRFLSSKKKKTMKKFGQR